MAVPRWIRRTLRVVLRVVAGLLAVLVVWIAGLLATNRGPTDSEGWTRQANMPEGRGETASAVRGGELYVIGGLGGPVGRTSQAVHVYTVADDSWRRGPDLPVARHHAAAAVLDGTIYVTGGGTSATDWTPRREMWALHDGADEWVPTRPLPEGRLGHDMVAAGGRLYVVGGQGDTTNVLIYDPDRGWTAGAPLGDRRDHLRAVVLDGAAGPEVWAIGGRLRDLIDRVDVYDPEANRWRRGPSLPRPMSAMAVGVLDGTIHVVGGENPNVLGGRVFNRHLVLEFGTLRWFARSDPMLAVHGAGYGVVDGTLHIAGGSRRQGALSVLAWTGLTQSFGAVAR